jgi:hypothetical protein
MAQYGPKRVWMQTVVSMVLIQILINNFCFFNWGSRVISGSIMSDYGLADRAIGVRSPAGAKDFSSILWVQTGSGAHPASSPMGTGGPFPGGKARPGRDADHSPPSSEWVGAILPLPPSASMAFSGTALLYFFNWNLEKVCKKGCWSNKTCDIYWLAERLLASEKGLCCM